MRSRGVVRSWNDEEGWGVIDSDDTPGGCWAGFSEVQVSGYRSLRPGQRVEFTLQEGNQDGFDFSAARVTLDEEARRSER